MKLRNKNTGEIREIKNILVDGMFSVNSLAELNEEWEDYDDTKESWCISYIGKPQQYKQYVTGEDVELCKAIGNYFETKEEAEKAVEKLKAWKRLKDKGFEFCDWYASGYPGEFSIAAKGKNFDSNNIQHDLDLLFGGGE